MKKIKYLLLILFLFFPFYVNASDVDYDITAYKVDAYIKENGDVEVYEYIRQTGTFNGYVRELIYKGSNSTYNAKGISNIKVYDLNVNNLTKGKEFSLVDYGTNGSNYIYEMNKTYNGVDLKMYNATNDSSSGYVINYTLDDVVLVHDDIAEFFWNFIGEDFLDVLENVEINVYLPNLDESLRVWAHGPLYGEVYPKHDTISYLNAKIDFVNPREPIDVRMTFNKDNVKNSTNIISGNAMDKILEEETKRADEANRERENAKKIVLMQKISTGFYFVCLIGIIIYAYIKYDKEPKTNFDMEYYRDFPNNYGPEILEYLLKKNATTLGYSASILEIVRKRALKVEDIPDKKNDYKLVVSNNQIEELTSDEAKIFNFIINEIGNGQEVSMSSIKNYGKKEHDAKELLKSYNVWQASVTKNADKYNFYEKNKTLPLVLITIILAIVTAIFVSSLSPIICILVVLTGIITMTYLIVIKKRTKEGTLEYAKWQAFKKFLVDFGRFDEKELPEIALWEKYLVYATVLGVAEKLEKTMKIKIQEFSNKDADFTDIYMMHYLMHANIASTVNTTISKAINVSNTTIANSVSSSGSGFGGGFSGGGGFGGGGGGGHGF